MGENSKIENYFDDFSLWIAFVIRPLSHVKAAKNPCNNAWFAVVMPKVSIWNMIDAFFHRKPGQQYTLYNF